MIGVIQRVKSASVEVDNQIIGSIQQGVLLFLGIQKHDNNLHIEKLAKKVANLRIFEDTEHKMNLSIQDTKGELLVVSQFTLAAETSKGNRPGFSSAAHPKDAEVLYDAFITHYNNHYGKVQTGQYGASMQVQLVNDGPATFILSV